MHYQRLKKLGTLDQPLATAPDAERFWSKVDRSVGPDLCWIWSGGTGGNRGQLYGHVWWNGATRLAHRIAYELTRGAIPEGLTLDHVKARGCTTSLCVNPAHLEPVGFAVNNGRGTSPSAINARKTHCKHGHEFTPGNTYIHPKRGTRNCRTCIREANARAGRRRATRQAGAGVEWHSP